MSIEGQIAKLERRAAALPGGGCPHWCHDLHIITDPAAPIPPEVCPLCGQPAGPAIIITRRPPDEVKS